MARKTLSLAFLLTCVPVVAEAQIYDLVVGHAPIQDRMPGAGVTMAGMGFPFPSPEGPLLHGPTTIFGSSPNAFGAWSATTFVAGNVPDVLLPSPSDVFLTQAGEVELDPAVLAGGSGSPITRIDMHEITWGGIGWELGSFASTSITGGTYDAATGAFTMTGNFAVSTPFGDFTPRLTVSGELHVVDPSGGSSGIDYVDRIVPAMLDQVGAGEGVVVAFHYMGADFSSPIAFRTAIVGASRAMPPDTVDLSLAVALDAPGPFGRLDTVAYTVTVTNEGTTMADGVSVLDVPPPEVLSTTQSCTSVTNRGGTTIEWRAGPLAPGASASCTFTAMLDPGTTFDFRTRTSVLVDEAIDSAIDDNFVSVVVPIEAGAEGLAQPVDTVNGVFPSDHDCDNCFNTGGGAGSQGLADNFEVQGHLDVCEIVFRGGYSDNVPFTDVFHLRMYADDPTSVPPGLAEASRPGPLPIVPEVTAGFTRMGTSTVVRGAFNVFEYRVPVRASLDRGRYWLMIWNDSSDAPGMGDWWWAIGQPEERSGAHRFAASLNTPPREPTARWIPNRSLSGLSFELVPCTPGLDAGVLAGTDAGTSSGTDGGGTTTPPASGGCGCRAGGRSSAGLGLVLIVLALVRAGRSTRSARSSCRGS